MVLYFTFINDHQTLYLLINKGLKVSLSPIEILSSSFPNTKSQVTMSTTMVPSPPFVEGI